MDYFKKVIVYYRDMPSYLTNIILSDSLMSINKDGVVMCDPIGKRVPRITILIKSVQEGNSANDKLRLKRLEQHLDYLMDSNQIISYKIV